jgi:hypothetical protein
MPQPNRFLPEWIRELRPHAIWFLVTLVGSALGAAIIRWIPRPSVQTIVIGIVLCLNALVMGWLSWLRARSSKQGNALAEQNRQEMEQNRQELDRLHRRIAELQNDLIGRIDRVEAETSPIFNTFPTLEIAPNAKPAWDIQEQEAGRQWAQLNTAEQALVGFVLVRGIASTGQILSFGDQEGLSKPNEILAWIKRKTSFLIGQVPDDFRINPEMKPYLAKIIAKDKGQAAHS